MSCGNFKGLNKMSIKNKKITAKDLKAGVTVYVSTPNYKGIDKYVITGKAKINEYGFNIYPCRHFHFVNGQWRRFNASNGYFPNDAGLSPSESYNGRRTFRKLKHAQEWANRTQEK